MSKIKQETTLARVPLKSDDRRHRVRHNSLCSLWLSIYGVLFLTGFTFSALDEAWADEASELGVRMQQMQEKDAALGEQLNKQGQIIERLTEKLEALESKGIEPGGLSNNIPQLKITGSSDIGFIVRITDNQDSNTFNLGTLGLFITSEISDRVSFLAETQFHFSSDTNSADFELERAYLKYSFSDLFNIKLGKIHTPLGYWNQAYHHGTWFQTTVFRPEVYLFEHDGGGYLPLHLIGVTLSGIKEFAPLDLEYHFSLGNGRGKTKMEVQDVKDDNDSKGIDLFFSLKPHFIDGLKLGANVYLDRIPPDLDVSARAERIDELIVGSCIAYTPDRIELLGEFFNIDHDDKTSGKDFATLGFYLQAGYKIAQFKPYYRFDFLDFADTDPYFIPDALDIKKHSLGIRWDIFTWNVLKFEYSFNNKKDTEDEHSFVVNSSFVF